MTHEEKKEKYYLFGNDNCPACKIVENTLKEEVEEGNLEYEVIDVLSPTGREMAKRLDILAVPRLYKLDKSRGSPRLVEEELEFEEGEEEH